MDSLTKKGRTSLKRLLRLFCHILTDVRKIQVRMYEETTKFNSLCKLYLNFLYVHYSPGFILLLFSLYSLWLDSLHGNRNIGSPSDPQSFVPESECTIAESTS